MQSELFATPVLDGLVEHVPGHFSGMKLEHFWRDCDLEQYEWSIMGKRGPKPRLERFFADVAKPLCYVFAGTAVYSVPMPRWMVVVAEQLEDRTKSQFNSCFVNAYRNGHDSIDWHDDRSTKGKGLVIGPVIASVTLCEPSGVRPFQMRPHEKTTNGKRPIVSFMLAHGDLLVMNAGTQERYQHRVPKAPLRERDAMGRRMNFTFRRSTMA